MQGYLKIFVLRELAQRELTGYDIMKGFESFSGAKMPSPGTMYPMLNDLLKKRLIAVTEKDHKKFYRITSSGKKVMQLMMEQRKKMLRSMLPVLSRVYSGKELENFKQSLDKISEKRHYEDMDVVHELRDAVFGFVASEAYPKKRSEFRKIIVAAAKKIRGLA